MEAWQGWAWVVADHSDHDHLVSEATLSAVPHPSPFVPGSPWFIGNRRVYSAGESATAIVDVPDERLDPQVREAITETVAGYGWKLYFEDEPNGSVTGYLVDRDTDEVIKTAVGTDFHDAWLELGVDTHPPSQELREDRAKTSD